MLSQFNVRNSSTHPHCTQRVNGSVREHCGRWTPEQQIHRTASINTHTLRIAANLHMV